MNQDNPKKAIQRAEEVMMEAEISALHTDIEWMGVVLAIRIEPGPASLISTVRRIQSDVSDGWRRE